MRRLLDEAERILETAVSAASAAPQTAAICVTASGGIRIIDAPHGWTLPALAAHNGADTVYLVEQSARQVRVEAWSRGESCVLVREAPGALLRHQEQARGWCFGERAGAAGLELVPVHFHSRPARIRADYPALEQHFQVADLLQQERPLHA